MNPAMERCEKLLKLAFEKPENASRYVSLARKIAMRHRLKLGRRRFCRNCSALFPQNLKVRLDPRRKTVIYTCRNCNKLQRLPYKRKNAITEPSTWFDEKVQAVKPRKVIR